MNFAVAKIWSSRASSCGVRRFSISIKIASSRGLRAAPERLSAALTSDAQIAQPQKTAMARAVKLNLSDCLDP